MIEININLVKKLIEEQFPQWSELPIYPVENGGNDNRTFHLGSEMSVRLPSAEQYAPQVEKENLWLPFLGEHLQLPISLPIAKGKPNEEFPWNWSVCKWVNGNAANKNNIEDLGQFAKELADFLKELQSIDSSGGPIAGEHNFHRGGLLSVYNKETRETAKKLKDTFDEPTLLDIWEKALKSEWLEKPVWVHGDIAPGNLLVNDEGILCAVIDFGILGVGDPACDLAMAWTFFDSESRKIFKDSLALDEDTWDRGRAWALWKTLITYEQSMEKNLELVQEMEVIISEIVNDFKNE